MDTTTAKHYTQCFDEQLLNIPHYNRYPLMRPFVGSHYGAQGPKILLIAESHYLPEDSTVHLDADYWYAGYEGDLTPMERRWTYTRGILNKSKGRWHAKGHAIYRNLEKALVEAGYPASDNTFKFVAFMNAFQRPAITGNSIASTERDVEVSSQTLNGVIEVLRPDHVVFVSSLSKRLIGRKLDVPSYSTPRPASAWWQRPSKKGTGKAQFIKLISDFLTPSEATT